MNILRKTIVLGALLAAAGCTKKAASDCEPSIARGMDNFTATIKGRATNPQMQDSMMTVIGKLKTTLTERCVEDKWAPEVVSCFTTVTNMKDMQACQAKLSEDQRTKVSTALREVMMSSRGQRMAPGAPIHPTVVPGSGDAPGSGSPAGSPPPAGSSPPAGSGPSSPPAGAAAPTPPPTGSAAAAPGAPAAAAGSASK